jgi:hypothetical protein
MPAGAILSVTSGASAIAQAETSTYKQNDLFVDFAASVQTFAEWCLVLPSTYMGGGFLATFYWTTASASGNSVVWGIQAKAYSAGDAIDSAYGSTIEVTSANGGANKENVTANTSLVAIAGAASTGSGASSAIPQRCKFRVYRLGSGADNLAATARLSAVRLLLSTNG